MKIHTRGNSDTEILKSLEDPENLFKKKDREKIDFSLFGASSSWDSHSIFDQEWEVNIRNGLLKSKSKSDLKNAEFNSHRLESYLLDSLWRDLQQSAKVEETLVVRERKSATLATIFTDSLEV